MIFGKLEYRFIWIVLGLSIRATHLKVHEQLVPECGRKKGKDLKGSIHCQGEERRHWWQSSLIHGVAIAHGKGVIKCHHYNGSINAETFADFVKAPFPEIFKTENNTKGRLFLQDGNPSQNSRMAQDAMNAIQCRRFKIPARSPGLKPKTCFILWGTSVATMLSRKTFPKKLLNSFVGVLKRVY